MQITMTTPALLFPAITLMLLAYTNRFNSLAGLLRHLYRDYCRQPHPAIRLQIDYLLRRVILIKNMQFLAVSSLFLCVFCMLLLVFHESIAAAVFVLSLLFLLGSLGISIWEIHLSVAALNIQLADLDRSSVERDGCPLPTANDEEAGL